MADADRAVSLIVGLLVAALLTAFLIPVGVGPMAGPETATDTQGVDDVAELQPDLNVTVTDLSEDTDAVYTIEAGDDSVTDETIDEGEDTTVTVDGADVTIAPTEVGSDEVTTDYEYPVSYGWGSGAGALWGILPVMIVLGVFLYLTYMAVRQFR